MGSHGGWGTSCTFTVTAVIEDALGSLGQVEPGVVKGLVGLLDDADEHVRGRAADALGSLGKAEPGVVEGLVGLLGDEDENVRGSAASALDPIMQLPDHRNQQIPPKDIPTLINFLGDEREVEYPLFGIRNTVKDVAWRLLQRYSEQTGERIYRDDGGE